MNRTIDKRLKRAFQVESVEEGNSLVQRFSPQSNLKLCTSQKILFGEKSPFKGQDGFIHLANRKTKLKLMNKSTPYQKSFYQNNLVPTVT